MITQHLTELINKTWQQISQNKLDFTIEEPPKNISKQADFATNICFLGAKLLKKPPLKIAEEFIAIFKNNPETKDFVEDVFVLGAGFVNFVLAKKIFTSQILELYKTKQYFPKTNNPTKILIEFVSANPTGPLHIGHARGAVIGDSLARLLTKLGNSVDKEYYVNNAGNQIDVLAKTLEIRYRQLLGENIELNEDSYKGEYMIDIAKGLIPADFCKQKSATESLNFKKIVVDEILGIIGNDLKNFNIDFKNWFLETSLLENNQLENVLEKLKKSGHLKFIDGAWWLMAQEFGDDDKNRVVVRQDGRPTYFALDIAYHENKFSRGYDKLINIWGADHHGYVARLKAVVSYLGHSKDDLNIILYNLVSLLENNEKVSMSTRSGEFVSLQEVIDEVGVDATRFFLLMRDPNSPLDFDLELAKQKSSDNPVYYVQYAHARICSILDNAKNNNIFPDDKNFIESINEPEEINLIKCLLNYSNVINNCVKDSTAHYITAYLLELASTFHNYYSKHKISENPNRLLLCQIIADVIKDGLNILGVSVPNKM